MATAKKIENTIRFLERLKDANSLTERFFRSINENSVVVDILAEVRNESYLNLCRKAYDQLQTFEEVCDIMNAS